MSKGPWLTIPQREALIASYLKHGLEATKPLALSYGVKTRTIAAVVRRAGKSPPKKRRVVVKRERGIDPRWQWAIERGVISI